MTLFGPSGTTSGAGNATVSAVPSMTLAFAPASRFASISLISSIPRSSCSSVIALTPPVCSNFISRGTRCAQIFITDFHISRRLLLTHLFNRGRPVLFEVGSEREQEILVERSTCSLQGPARVSSAGVQKKIRGAARESGLVFLAHRRETATCRKVNTPSILQATGWRRNQIRPKRLSHRRSRGA